MSENTASGTEPLGTLISYFLQALRVLDLFFFLLWLWIGSSPCRGPSSTTPFTLTMPCRHSAKGYGICRGIVLAISFFFVSCTSFALTLPFSSDFTVPNVCDTRDVFGTTYKTFEAAVVAFGHFTAVALYFLVIAIFRYKIRSKQPERFPQLLTHSRPSDTHVTAAAS